MLDIIILFIVFIMLCVIRVPIIFALLLSSYLLFRISGLLLFQNYAFLARTSFFTLDMFAIIAVPFFLLVGNLSRYGVAASIVRFVNVFFGWIKGSLSLVTIVSSLFFGAIVGSVMATLAGIGSIMIPIMTKAGYKREEAAALATATSIVGILIPPSVTSILIAMIANISVAAVFLTSVGPAFLLAIGFFAISYYQRARHIPAAKFGSEVPEGQSFLKFYSSTVVKTMPAFGMPIIVLGGIYGGVFTPTEAGVVSVIYLFFYILLTRQNVLKIFRENLVSVAALSGTVLLLFAFSAPIGRIISAYRVSDLILDWMLALTENTMILVLLFNLIVIIMGMFLETTAIIILVVPIFLPVLVELGIHPWHFTGMFEANLATGMLTPPFGYAIYMGAKVAQVEIHTLVYYLLPYFVWCFISLMLLTFFPAISMWLPTMILPY